MEALILGSALAAAGGFAGAVGSALVALRMQPRFAALDQFFETTVERLHNLIASGASIRIRTPAVGSDPFASAMVVDAANGHSLPVSLVTESFIAERNVRALDRLKKRPGLVPVDGSGEPCLLVSDHAFQASVYEAGVTQLLGETLERDRLSSQMLLCLGVWSVSMLLLFGGLYELKSMGLFGPH